MDAALAFRGRDALPAVPASLAQERPYSRFYALKGQDQSGPAFILDVAGQAHTGRVGGIDAALVGNEQLGVVAAFASTDFKDDLHGRTYGGLDAPEGFEPPTCSL